MLLLQMFMAFMTPGFRISTRSTGLFIALSQLSQWCSLVLGL